MLTFYASSVMVSTNSLSPSPIPRTSPFSELIPRYGALTSANRAWERLTTDLRGPMALTTLAF